jgi:hypothetical protein
MARATPHVDNVMPLPAHGAPTPWMAELRPGLAVAEVAA